MTVNEIEQAAKEQYNAVSDTFFSSASIWNLIFRAQMTLAQNAKLIEAVDTATSTVSGTRAYAFPTYAMDIKRLEYNSVALVLIDFAEDDLVTISTTATGTPLYYSVWNFNVYLRPIPDAVQTLRFYTYNRPIVISAGTDTPQIPTQFHQSLIDYILWQMALKDQNVPLAREYQTAWEQWVQDAIVWQAKRRRAGGNAQVKDEDLSRLTILGMR